MSQAANQGRMHAQ
ncbi:hypothetical protein Tco_1206798, partial [Tanacetum coccineum]